MAINAKKNWALKRCLGCRWFKSRLNFDLSNPKSIMKISNLIRWFLILTCLMCLLSKGQISKTSAVETKQNLEQMNAASGS
jgi:hypothetical protein